MSLLVDVYFERAEFERCQRIAVQVLEISRRTHHEEAMTESRLLNLAFIWKAQKINAEAVVL
jgi:hypothetical protein